MRSDFRVDKWKLTPNYNHMTFCGFTLIKCVSLKAIRKLNKLKGLLFIELRWYINQWNIFNGIEFNSKRGERVGDNKIKNQPKQKQINK